jgi:hypothetical protein
MEIPSFSTFNKERNKQTKQTNKQISWYLGRLIVGIG